ncbi:MAG TPA: T9SS type A sorting domain-containing protein [Ignavibacteriaceae bacterium]|nr:T9SS type A sorting domain-containing protein [Ignavibacteriaceae bacterium]
MKISKIFAFVFVLFNIFVFSGCIISDVNQSNTVQTGGTFTSTLTISEMTAENSNAHKGILCVLVPNDWTFTSGSFTSTVGVGTMEVNLDPNPPYGDIDTIIAAPAGMKWVDLISNVGYLHPANVVIEVTVNFQAGTTIGTFPIGYASTVNTLDMMKSINQQDVDNDASWTDTSMNHMVTITGPAAVDEQISGIPSDYNLSQNYPNPFNPSTSFTYSIKQSGNVQISLFDASGKEVKTLVNGFRNAGNYMIHFNASDFASGIYYYRIITNDFVKTNKMVLMK